MTQQSQAGRRWLLAIAGVLGILLLAACGAVFLVLTGIIAEPETVIENMVRWLLGQ